MSEKELFPEIRRVEPPPKIRKSRKKSTRYNKTENNRRYKLHRRVKDLDNIRILPREKTVFLPLGFNLEFYPSVEELVLKFKYFAPTEITPNF